MSNVNNIVLDVSGFKLRYHPSSGMFAIEGNPPDQNLVYELALEYNLNVDEEVFHMLEDVLGVVSIEELERTIKEFFRSRGKYVEVRFVEEAFPMQLSNTRLVVPIVSRTSGVLGSVILTGKFEFKKVLGFLAFYDSFVSVLEGIVITRRMEELLKSGLDTIHKALVRRARISDEDMVRMETLAFKLCELECIETGLCELALKCANVGLIGVEDRVFEELGSGSNVSKEILNAYMKHVDYGVDILSKLELESELIDVCLYHHEHIDGSGYKGLTEGSIPKLALIVGFAEHVVILREPLEILRWKYPERFLRVLG